MDRRKFLKWLKDWPVDPPSEFKPTYRDLEADIKVLKEQVATLQAVTTRLRGKLMFMRE